MTVWFKRDCGMSSNRKVMAACKVAHGVHTLFIWEELLALNTEGDKDGFLSAIDTRPDLMTDSMSFWGITMQIASESLEALVEVGLLQSAENGFRIAGWEDFKPNLTPAEKQKRYRKRRKEALPDEGNGVTHTGNAEGNARLDIETRVTPRQSRKTEEREQRDRAERADDSAQVSPGDGVASALGLHLPRPGRKKSAPAALSMMLHDLGFHPKSTRHRNEKASELSEGGCTLNDLGDLGKHAKSRDGVDNPTALLATWLNGDWKKVLHEISQQGAAT